MTQHPQDHYATLGIDTAATIGEIRQAFRRLAKQHHPDKNRDDADRARVLFERTTEAYRVLSDARQRELYDRDHKRRPRRPPTAPDDLCVHILELLLDELVDEAIEAFDALRKKVPGPIGELDLPRYMDYQDARDCEFLLAEALERHDRTVEALALYQLALERESRRPHFRAFTQEVRTRVKRLHIQKLQEEIREAGRPASLDDALEAVFRIGLTRRERAHCYKAVGAALEAADEFQLAREAVGKALRICPSLSGVKRLCERLDLDAQGAPIDTPPPHTDPAAQHAG